MARFLHAIARGNRAAEIKKEVAQIARIAMLDFGTPKILRVSPPGTEWKAGRKPKREKIGRKIENLPRPDMGEKWPKNSEK